MNSTYNPTEYKHIFVRQWDDGTHYNLAGVCLEVAEEEEKFIIHILSLEEGVPSNYCQWISNPDNPDADRYLQLIQDKDIHVDVYVGTHTHNYDNHFGSWNLSRYKNHRVLYDPSFFIKKTFAGFSSHPYSNPLDDDLTTNYLNKLIKPIGKTKFHKLFMSLNGAPRYHRMLLLDSIYDAKLWNRGYITWFGNNNRYNLKMPDYLICMNMSKKAEKKIKSRFTRWMNDIYTLPSQTFEDFPIEDNTDPNQFQDLFPLEARNCVLSVIGETDTDVFFLTEKTSIPLALGKPVLVLGCKGFHTQYMSSMGFALHHNVIDYSFDKEDNVGKRVEGIVDNLRRLESDYKDNYEELYRLMYPVCAYNSRNVLDIAKTRWNGVTERALALTKYEIQTKYSIAEIKKRHGSNEFTLPKKTYRDMYENFVIGRPGYLERLVNYTGNFPMRLSNK
jgi:hypothetical protein